MSVELRPLGVGCNIGCKYCYQQPQRDAGNLRQPYDWEQMKTAIQEAGGNFVLFGGEPLLLPISKLEEIWRWGFEKYGRNSVQTNGTLISDEHLRLFRTYNVEVGISIDGPSELNDARWSKNLEHTREMTRRAEQAIERVTREWRPPGIIVTLHRTNARSECLPRMAEWMRKLDRLGIKSMRLHILEVDHAEVEQTLALSARENVEAMLFFARLQEELTGIRFDVIEDIKNLLLGKEGGSSCVWRGCDPYTTPAVQGVEGNGQSSNCGRVNKDGVDFTKADWTGFERYIMLHQTPQEHNGCKDCRFFLMCRGQCPGTAIDGDWRNRTEHCSVWKSLFECMESRLVNTNQSPLSLQPERQAIEQQMLQLWMKGKTALMEDLAKKIREQERVA